MTITRNFIFETDRELGVRGLRPVWIQNANATYSIAHDVLEHFSVEKGSPVAAELQAIGACLALRIQTGVLYSSSGSPQLLASPIADTLQDAIYGSIEITAAPSTRPLGEEHEWAEALIQNAIPLAFARLDRDNEGDEAWLSRSQELKQQRSDVVSWLRIGHRRAIKRYQGKDLYTLGACLFDTINKASERLVRSELLLEGSRVTVNVDPRYLDVSFSIDGRRFLQ